MRLYSDCAERLYVNRSERQRFLAVADKAENQTKLLCLTLIYTGCRLSEAINLTWNDIQWHEGIVSIKSLKKRDQHHTREIPVPAEFIRQINYAKQDNPNGNLFNHDRTTGWRRIKAVMSKAEIEGTHATPKGLRHSFGMWAAYNGIPITLCQKWMGHADIRTTAIYYQIVGKDEIEIAARMW